MKIKQPRTIILELMKENNLTVKEVADRIGHTQEDLEEITIKKKTLSEMMAIDFERAFGISREILLARGKRKREKAKIFRRKVTEQVAIKHTPVISYEDYLEKENAKLVKKGKISEEEAKRDTIRNMRRNKGINGGGISHRTKNKTGSGRSFNGKVLGEV